MPPSQSMTHLTLAAGHDAEHSVPNGLERLVIEVTDVEMTANVLNAIGAKIKWRDNALQISRAWAGILIEVRVRAPAAKPHLGAAGVMLDQVALLVTDVTAMAHRGSLILGGPPAQLGMHPLGTSVAARFLLYDRMIEWLAPLSNQAAPLSKRLDRFGEGPFALARIAPDLDATVAAGSAVGARIIDQPPHIIVHPSDASGVAIQLMPRVRH